MRVQEISGKDVHNMKARSTLLPHKTRSKLSRSGRQIQDLRGGPGRPFRAKKRQKNVKNMKKLEKARMRGACHPPTNLKVLAERGG